MVKKVMTAPNFDPDEETARMTERMVVLRIATKHINLWVRQLKMKRKQIGANQIQQGPTGTAIARMF